MVRGQVSGVSHPHLTPDAGNLTPLQDCPPMVFLLYFILIYIALYFLVPKGFFLYEGLRFPIWSFKMKMFPKNGLEPEKHHFGRHKRQYLIHYRPRQEATQNGHVFIYIHGGGWQFGKPEMFRPNAQLLDQLGFHSFFISHRRIPAHNVRHMVEDVALGVRNVIEVMKAEGIAHKGIILGGVSSGANLAALLYYDERLLSEKGISRTVFSGLLLMAPPLNLEAMWRSPTLRFFAGKRDGEMFKDASPINHLTGGEDIPTLIVHPEKDGMVSLKSTKTFIEKTSEMQVGNIEFHVLPGMTHMDAASWCFEGHPSQAIVLEWMGRFLRGE